MDTIVLMILLLIFGAILLFGARVRPGQPADNGQTPCPNPKCRAGCPNYAAYCSRCGFKVPGRY